MKKLGMDTVIVIAIILVLFICLAALIAQPLIGMSDEVAEFLQGTVLGQVITFLAAAWRAIAGQEDKN